MILLGALEENYPAANCNYVPLDGGLLSQSRCLWKCMWLIGKLAMRHNIKISLIVALKCFVARKVRNA